eukprot:TRINITY_DN2476_c0_g3_i3.p1 TRINITY_DN2476_c0_g3~~TRINITY_DN2476_c0_g3_i3.p1  ORF type:complete len:220 (-),score=51.28 TRINITY_DN2476_c0_g3_i3:183-842(-)
MQASSSSTVDPQEVYEFLFKFIIIGDTGTGKSCLLHRFIERKFKSGSKHTIGVEFGSKVVNAGGKNIKLQIWDTAGQERFRSVTRSYYRGAAGALLVYDITNRQTYNNIANWLSDARNLANEDIVMVLVGNKKDKEEREVTFMEASQFAQQHNLMFLETSAASGDDVDEAFLKCAKSILSKVESGLLDPTKTTSGIQYSSTTTQKRTDKAQPSGSGCPC